MTILTAAARYPPLNPNPPTAAYFLVNDTLNQLNPYREQKDLIGLLSKFVCAQTGAISAAYASFPFDTVRRFQQVQCDKSFSEAVSSIYEYGGIQVGAYPRQALRNFI